jgi:tartrate dehydratase beta subunit/fumarate hydratase class I family protein
LRKKTMPVPNSDMACTTFEKKNIKKANACKMMLLLSGFLSRNRDITAKRITVLLDAGESTKNYITDLKLFTLHCKIFQPRG